MLNLFLNLSSHPLDIVNSESPSSSLGRLAFPCNIGPVRGIFLIVAFCYHSYVTSSIFCVCDALARFESAFLLEIKALSIVISILYFSPHTTEIGILYNICVVSTNTERVPKSMSDNRILKISSWIRGFHVYKDWWTPTCGEILLLQPKPENAEDKNVVAVLKESRVREHIPFHLANTRNLDQHKHLHVEVMRIFSHTTV